MRNIITNVISCDLLIPVTKVHKLKKIIEEAAKNPAWLRHNFIAVLDSVPQEEEKMLQEWYYDNRIKQSFPHVIIIKAPVDYKRNRPALFQMALKSSENPYVFFYNDKDPLPLNLDRAIKHMYENPDLDVCFAQCQTFLKDGKKLEIFPTLNQDDKFNYDCVQASKLFPSYVHPLSGVFKKEILKSIPYWDMQKHFRGYHYYYFILRLLNNSVINFTTLPYIIRRSVRNGENASMINGTLRTDLVHDLKMCLEEMPETEYKDFQYEIVGMLEKADIVTFKEIDARIEEFMDSHK